MVDGGVEEGAGGGVGEEVGVFKKAIVNFFEENVVFGCLAVVG